MERIEKFSAIFLFAGLLLFLTAVLGLAAVPIWMVQKTSPEAGLPTTVPDEFAADYADVPAFRRAVFRGRDLYIREACWHCHSQYVRPTANENLRYGPVSTPGESNNQLNLPQLFGTRRVGPDLSREGGLHSNDWHYAHLYKPTNVVPQSVMPQYPWYFEMKDEIPVPNEDAKALVAYLQWLGSEMKGRKETRYEWDQQVMPPRE